jgi:hypothetical protein
VGSARDGEDREQVIGPLPSESDVNVLRQLGVAFVEKGPAMGDALVAELSKRRSVPPPKAGARRAPRARS